MIHVHTRLCLSVTCLHEWIQELSPGCVCLGCVCVCVCVCVGGGPGSTGRKELGPTGRKELWERSFWSSFYFTEGFQWLFEIAQSLIKKRIGKRERNIFLLISLTFVMALKRTPQSIEAHNNLFCTWHCWINGLNSKNNIPNTERCIHTKETCTLTCNCTGNYIKAYSKVSVI